VIDCINPKGDRKIDMAKEESKKAAGKEAEVVGEQITLREGATIRNSDGVPQRLLAAVKVSYELRQGRGVVLAPMELLGFWFDSREV